MRLDFGDFALPLKVPPKIERIGEAIICVGGRFKVGNEGQISRVKVGS